MLEVKQGRAASFIGGIVGLAFAGCGAAFLLGTHPPISVVVFCCMFILIGLSIAVYSFWNAMARNRPDMYDVTSDRQEPDPLNQRFGRQ